VNDGLLHPASEDEVARLVTRARREGQQVRVRGSAHSVAGAIRSDRGMNLRLDQLDRVTFDDLRMQVTVQGGCHLGRDPRDPTGASTWERSLLAALVARGWALPDLGGVAHQTIAGFLATGSSGGTIRHAIEDAVVAVRVVDGTGEVRQLVRGRDEAFHAVTCAMGLLGVVTEVTLQCVPHYDVIGREDITTEADAAWPFYADGGLEGHLRRTEYARLMWWPQDGVRRVVSWQARRMTAADHTRETGPPGALVPRPYRVVGDAGRWPLVGPLLNQGCQAGGGAFYTALAGADRAWAPIAERSRRARALGDRVRRGFGRRVLPKVIRPFVPLGTQRFWDAWHRALPLDEQMSETFLPTTFTEIWLPLDRAGEALRAVRALMDARGPDATGSYLVEVYGARATEGWLHPSTGRDSLRFDLFWYARNPSDPAQGWFVQFWETLRRFGYRLHWGKILPPDPALGARHLAATYPRWEDFLALRERWDPDGVFLTRYWARALGLGT
jgi:FAD/FMN-containing dehydrogenase